jgi:hypothetical protein
MGYDTLIPAHITSELSQLILHVSTVFISPQLALLAHNPVLLRKSIFFIAVNTKCFVIVILAWIFWDVITSLCLRGLIQAECSLRISLAFTFQGILNFNCCFYGEPVISSDLSALRPVFMADLFLCFGRGDMSVTLIAFSGPTTERSSRR